LGRNALKNLDQTDEVDGAACDFTDVKIENLFKEMKQSVKCYDACFSGSDFVDWLTVWKDWSRDRCRDFGNILLQRGFFEPLVQTPVPINLRKFEDDGSIYRFSYGGRTSYNLEQNLGSVSAGIVLINAGGQYFHTNEKTLSAAPGTFFQ